MYVFIIVEHTNAAPENVKATVFYTKEINTHTHKHSSHTHTNAPHIHTHTLLTHMC